MELQIDYGPGYRVYYANVSGRLVLLTGGNKKRQQEDIEQAKAILKDYRERNQ